MSNSVPEIARALAEDYLTSHKCQTDEMVVSALADKFARILADDQSLLFSVRTLFQHKMHHVFAESVAAEYLAELLGDGAVSTAPPPGPLGHWLRPTDATPKSYRFVCSVCGGSVYAVTGANRRKNMDNACSYRCCPHCFSRMDVADGREPGFQGASVFEAPAADSVQARFPDLDKLTPGGWSKNPILLRYGNSEKEKIEIGLYREGSNNPEYAGTYTLQIFGGDNSIFCRQVSPDLLKEKGGNNV